MKRHIYVLLLVLCSLFPLNKGFSQDDPHGYKQDKDKESYPEEKVDPYKTQDRKDKRTKKSLPSKREIVKRNFNIGIKGGMVFSYVSSEDFNFDRQIDGSVYFATDIRLYDSLFVEIDFGYHVTTFNSVSNFFKLEYFTIPIIFKYYFSKYFLDPNIMEFWAGIGLELRFKLGDNGFGSSTQSVDTNDQGVVFALGVRDKIYDDLYLTIDFRFYLGLSPAFTSTSNEKNYLREFELLFGLSYDLF